jgi:hypothetical protein
MQPQRFFLLVLMVVPALQGAPAQKNSVALEVVLERAAQYVAQYEDQLGNLLVTEDYLLRATFFEPDGVSVLGKPQLRLQSDFLILQAGPNRIGIRKVNQVDGLTVKSKEGSLENLMNDSPERIQRVREALREENVRYDIAGVLFDIVGVLRENNVPTFALKVLHKSEAPRFKFEKSGTEKIAAVQTWKVKFKNELASTLIHGKGGEPWFSSGFLWIEPNTGRILKTEFVLESTVPNQKARGQVIVTYSEEKKLDIYVPSLMIEHYETDESEVDIRAEYSNFRSFKIELETEIAR